ncbi:MAG: YfhO family protein [Nitrospirae bacterium]|nr:YfhO family protein [Nitrospirota bacterium]
MGHAPTINPVEKRDSIEVLSRRRTPFAFLLFVCLAAYALNANPFAGRTVAPFDRLLEFSGWSSVQSNVKAVHAERSDILDSQLPTWITLKDQIRKGESPLWYPNGAGGQPISLELCNPTFLLFLLVRDNALAYYLVSLAKLVISGFGAFLLFRIFLRWLPSVWGGIVFMLCGFNAAWFFWEQVTTAMWLPWLLWATVMYLKTEDRKWLPAITIASLLLIFGGFPAVAGFSFYAFSLLLLVWNMHSAIAGNLRPAFKDKERIKLALEKTALPLLAVGLAFLLSAVALIPFIDTMSSFNLGYRTSGGIPLRIHDLLLLLTYEDPPRVENTAYVGMLACVFSLVGIIAAFSGNDTHTRLFVFFHALLAAVTLSIAFGLLPHRLVEALPVFKNNPKWGRLLVVTLLGLAGLSTAGLDFGAAKLQAFSGGHLKLTPLNARRMVAVALIGIIAIQFHTQKKLFNRFNAVVPSAWFYPLTPSIEYVKEHLRPLQSVIADYSYWFAGTLGAYGIPEWYAHSFRTDREKEVLGELVLNPFSSPTSMFIVGSNIRFDSPWMNKLAIKYLLVNGEALRNRALLSLPELSRDAAPPLPYNSWKQHISLPADMVVGAIGFSFGTFGERHAPANVRLTLYADDGKKCSLESGLDGNQIGDNQWAFFEFPGGLFLPKGGYSLVLSLPGYTGPGRLTAWATKPRGNTGSFLEINGKRTDYSLTWKIGYYQEMDLSLLKKKWNVMNLEKDIVLFENRQVTDSAYFVKTLDASNEQTDFSGIKVVQQSPDFIKIDYAKGEAGWIVLPMHLHSGWKAYAGKRKVGYDAYMGMLPAIPVSGPVQLTFRYQPASFRKGLIVSSVGLLMFLAFSGLCLRKVKKRS